MYLSDLEYGRVHCQIQGNQDEKCLIEKSEVLNMARLHADWPGSVQVENTLFIHHQHS